MLSHTQARAVILRAWPGAVGVPPTLASLQAAQSVFAAESQYGAGWKGACAGSNNWGAVQSGRLPCGPGECEYTDTHPNSDGSSTKYQICFKTYATPEEGAAHALKVLFVRKGAKDAGVLKAAQSGDLRAFSAAMYHSGYYEGFGATPEKRMDNHYKYLRKRAEKIAAELGEPLADDLPPPKKRGGVLPWLIGGVAAAVVAKKVWG